MNTAALQVPLLDLKSQYLANKAEIDAAIQRVVESQHFINGPEVSALEQEVAAYCQTRHCVGVSSGSDALLVSLMALDVGPGDEVITTPYTFFATVGAIVRLGATPVFCDIDPHTYNLDVRQIESKVTPRTKAILPVHLFGQCADMDPILEVADGHGLSVIEDAAQAIGAEYQGRRAGSVGVVGCLSFFPAKNLGTYGDGGAIVTSDAELAERIRVLRGHGAKPKYFHHLVGGNFRLDALHAAVLRVKLRRLDEWTAARRANAAFYDDAFRQAGLEGEKVVTPVAHHGRHVFNQYVCRFENRDEVMGWLKDHNVGSAIYYPLCMHQQACFASLGHHPGDFPQAERASQETLGLPIYPELTDAQRRHVVDTLGEYYARSEPAILRRSA